MRPKTLNPKPFILFFFYPLLLLLLSSSLIFSSSDSFSSSSWRTFARTRRGQYVGKGKGQNFIGSQEGGGPSDTKEKELQKANFAWKALRENPETRKITYISTFSLFFLRVARDVVFPDLGLKALGPFRVPALGLLELSFSLFSLVYPEIIA